MEREPQQEQVEQAAELHWDAPPLWEDSPDEADDTQAALPDDPAPPADAPTRNPPAPGAGDPEDVRHEAIAQPAQAGQPVRPVFLDAPVPGMVIYHVAAPPSRRERDRSRSRSPPRWTPELVEQSRRVLLPGAALRMERRGMAAEVRRWGAHSSQPDSHSSHICSAIPL